MNYYRYCPDANGFAGIGTSPEDHDRVVDIHYQDAALAPHWKAIGFHGFQDNPRKEGDFPSLSDYREIPVMSDRAWGLLRPLIGYCCEALPIIHPSGKRYFIIHVMETIDCVDVKRSQLKRYSDGEIMRIIRYAFNSALLQGKHMFKLPRESAGELIVDDVFRKAVEDNQLEGLAFNELPVVT